ncbi:glycosyltransferase family 4 protein [Citricoccus sp. SGAir0253]|uniref:glycosyltransferase family 4 protein n=1 Tax=Citricoccus sp. SGAir0253 TaxID=2567881 RepID=UPI0010CD57FB|nr:glycosyltransferase family 4 protein [Citricoccus sp. SGAir0253]QCU78603.1 glycosyltransferase family 4 protein [Citricoccus sp. SGAir0253]
MDSLRIAMVAPPFFEVPPRGYGGIELVLAHLVDALVERGHDVTLVGAGGHGTRARFRRTYAVPQRERLREVLPEAVHAAAVAEVLDGLAVDLVHDHTLLGPLQARGRAVPTVVTVHGPVAGEPGGYYRSVGRSAHLVAISHAQRALAPDLHWAGTVHNALDPTCSPFRDRKEDWVLFLGRCTPDKGMHLAIDVARAAGRRIRIAAKCTEPPERRYFEAEIRPRLGPGVEWLGELCGPAKAEALAAARCLLFPLQWEEPFGMVLIEALAAGTPVVTMPRGAVPEIITDGVTGLVRDRVEDLVPALAEVGRIDPRRCRREVLERFVPATMAAGYEAVYRRVLDGAAPAPAPAPAAARRPVATAPSRPAPSGPAPPGPAPGGTGPDGAVSRR